MYKKLCRICMIFKLLKDFHQRKDSKDGHQSYCKQYKKLYDKPRKNRAGKNRRVSSKVRLKAKAKYRAKYPEREKAQQKIQRLLGYDKIQRKKCEICGELNAQAHHGDYSKFEEIIWLCQKHHNDLQSSKPA